MYTVCKKYGKVIQIITASLFMVIGIMMFILKTLEAIITILGLRNQSFLSSFIVSKLNPDNIDIILIFVALLGNFMIILLGIICIALCGKKKYSKMCLLFGSISLIISIIVPILNNNLIFMILCVLFTLSYSAVSYVLIKIRKKEEEENQRSKETYDISEDII